SGRQTPDPICALPSRAGSRHARCAVACPHLEAIAAGCDTAFTVDTSRVTFGAGALAEVGERARALGIRRAALFTDPRLRELPWFAEVLSSLRAAGIDACTFDAVAIEPTDASFEEA